MRIHNDSINVKLYDFISNFVTKIPSFPNKEKIKKSDEEELEINFDKLNLDESGDEDFKPKKSKRTKKNQLAESSEEDSDYIPVKGSQSKRKSLRNKITP